MTDQLAQVNPGDLIRASDYNQLIGQVNDLTTRVERLEAGGAQVSGQAGAPVITTINPPSPRIGDTVVITGRAFDYSVGAARVTLDGLFVTLLVGSSDTTLIFQVPQLASIPDGGRPAQLVVSNLRLSTSQSLIVLPEVPPIQGDVSIQFQDTQPAVIIAGQPCTFHFQLVSNATQPVTLTLTPTVSVPAWQAGLQVLDDTQSVLPTAQVTVGAFMTRDFFVRIAQITTAAQTFTLTVQGQGQGILTPPGVQTFTVGQAGAQDPNIRLTLEGVTSGTLSSGTTLTLTTGEQTGLTLLAKFHQTGHFDWSASFDPATSASSWQPDTTGVAPFDIAAADIQSSGPDEGWAVRPFDIGLTAPSTAQSANFTFTLKQQGETLTRSLTLQLVAAG